jgi:hypothetical protein
VNTRKVHDGEGHERLLNGVDWITGQRSVGSTRFQPKTAIEKPLGNRASIGPADFLGQQRSKT